MRPGARTRDLKHQSLLEGNRRTRTGTRVLTPMPLWYNHVYDGRPFSLPTAYSYAQNRTTVMPVTAIGAATYI